MWPNSKIGFIIGLILAILQIGAYNFTFLLNPGIPDRDLSKYDNGYLSKIVANPRSFCAICNLVKPEGMMILHCPDCDVCVSGK